MANLARPNRTQTSSHVEDTAFITITADYNVLEAKRTVYLDGTSNTVDAILAVSPVLGEKHTFKSINADFTCTVDGNGNNIDGSATRTLAVNVSITAQFEGTEWRIL